MRLLSDVAYLGPAVPWATEISTSTFSSDSEGGLSQPTLEVHESDKVSGMAQEDRREEELRLQGRRGANEVGTNAYVRVSANKQREVARNYLKSLKRLYKRRKAAYLQTHTMEEFRDLQAEVRSEERSEERSAWALFAYRAVGTSASKTQHIFPEASSAELPADRVGEPVWSATFEAIQSCSVL